MDLGDPLLSELLLIYHQGHALDTACASINYATFPHLFQQNSSLIFHSSMHLLLYNHICTLNINLYISNRCFQLLTYRKAHRIEEFIMRRTKQENPDIFILKRTQIFIAPSSNRATISKSSMRTNDRLEFFCIPLWLCLSFCKICL